MVTTNVSAKTEVKWNPDEWVIVRGTPQKKKYLLELQKEIGEKAKVMPDDGFASELLVLDQILRQARFGGRPFVKVIEYGSDRYIARPIRFEPEAYKMFSAPMMSDFIEVDEADWLNMDREQREKFMSEISQALSVAKWIWFVEPVSFIMKRF